jgi:integrase
MSGSNPPDRRIRLFDFLERYVEDYLKVKDSKSWRQELGRLRRIRRHFGDVWMHEIHSSDIEHFLADLLREGLKPATANRYRARLSSMTRKARAWGFRDDNPLEFIELFKEQRLGDRYLEPEEFRHLLEACDEDLRCLVLVAAYTGMRRGELLALRREDVDLERGYLLVRADHSKTSEGRVVPLNSEVMRALKALLPQPDGRLFPFEQFPRFRWDRVRHKLGWMDSDNPRLSRWRFHDLRHHAASQLVMADVPISKVAKILGHKELATTQRYAHLSDESLFEAVERIVLPHQRSCESAQTIPSARSG